MKKSAISLVVVVFVGVLFNGCASTKLTKTWVDKDFKGKTFSNILVIGVASEESNRRLFENRFVQQLKDVGVTAVSSADVIPIPADQKLKKEMLTQTVDKFNNDAVLITHIAGINKRKSYQPAVYTLGVGYYGGYGYYHATRIKPSSVRSHTELCLETALYDVESEKLVWSGQSQTWETDSVRKLIDGVIKVVIKDIQKNKFLSKK